MFVKKRHTRQNSRFEATLNSPRHRAHPNPSPPATLSLPPPRKRPPASNTSASSVQRRFPSPHCPSGRGTLEKIVAAAAASVPHCHCRCRARRPPEGRNGNPTEGTSSYLRHLRGSHKIAANCKELQLRPCGRSSARRT